MEKIRNKILIIGPYPPPFGGVSMHIKRLSLLLGNKFEIDYIDESYSIKENYFNLRSLNIFKYLKKIAWSDLLYIHSGGKFLKILHILIGKMFNKKVIITIHSYPVIRPFFLKFWDELFFKFTDCILVVNPDILKRLSLPLKKCIIQHAFIPPIVADQPSLPASVVHWIEEKKKEGKIIICANAWQLKSFNGHDLYGLDLCIDVAKQLINQGYKIGFIFIVSSIEKYEEVYWNYNSIIEKSDLKEHFLLSNIELSFVKLIEMSDIILRPTNTDGDALTVREALYLGKTVIASDVVNRPEGTILFKSRDPEDMKNKITETIKYWSVRFPVQLQNDLMEYQRFYAGMINKIIQL